MCIYRIAGYGFKNISGEGDFTCHIIFLGGNNMSDYTFNGLGTHIGNLATLSDAKTRSISPENFDGKKGGGA